MYLYKNSFIYTYIIYIYIFVCIYLHMYKRIHLGAPAEHEYFHLDNLFTCSLVCH